MSYVFGMHAVESVLKRNPKSVQRLWLQFGRNDARIEAVASLARNQGIAVERAARAQLDDWAAGRHQGVVAEVLEKPKAQLQTLSTEGELLSSVIELDRPCLLLVLDGVTDPHNLGACLRSADAAGVDGVIVPRDKAVGLTPTVRKVACGAAETVPFVQVTNLARTLQALKDAGVWIYGTAGDAPGTVFDSDLSGNVALVMGAEGSGLRRLTKEHCDVLIRLPMAGSVTSLNVSVAAGICLFEVVRQRAQAFEPSR